MKKILVGMICGFLVLGASVTASAASKPTATQAVVAPKVGDAEFGLFKMTASGNWQFTPATVVPNKPGQHFGWVLHVEPRHHSVQWREEFTLPAQPQTWGKLELAGVRVISGDGRTVMTKRESLVRKGLIFNVWEIAVGDPSGPSQIQVFLGDKQVGDFSFEIK